jgi:hypothetical protein
VLDLRDTYEIGGPGKTILETFRFIDATRFDLHLGVFLRPDEGTDSPFLQEARRMESRCTPLPAVRTSSTCG